MDIDSAAADTRAILGELESNVLAYERALQVLGEVRPSTDALIESMQAVSRALDPDAKPNVELLVHQLLTLVAAHDQRSRSMSSEAIDTLLGGIDVLMEVTRRPSDAEHLTRPYLERIMALVGQLSSIAPKSGACESARAVPPSVPPAPPRDALKPVNQTRRILIVEDDFVSRSLLLAMLDRYGQCDVAVNGVEAVSAVDRALEKSWQYDLITLDIMMPELGGHEALAAIRISEATKHLAHSRRAKVIMTTALSDYENFHRAYLGSCDAYIVKPLSKAVLVRQLRRVGIE